MCFALLMYMQAAYTVLHSVQGLLQGLTREASFDITGNVFRRLCVL